MMQQHFCLLMALDFGVTPDERCNVVESMLNIRMLKVCEGCGGECPPGSVAVFAERAGSQKCWHPSCFRCSDCSELLVDLIYFWDQDALFCGRHYADRHRPRCNACDELIMSGQYTQAEDVNWHVEHFCCWNCDTLLGGHQYINKEGHPYCMNCYNEKFAKVSMHFCFFLVVSSNKPCHKHWSKVKTVKESKSKRVKNRSRRSIVCNNPFIC